jgi:hypothetical protein
VAASRLKGTCCMICIRVRSDGQADHRGAEARITSSRGSSNSISISGSS